MEVYEYMALLRTTMVGLAVAMAVGMIGSASAAAASCKSKNEKWVACNASNEVIAEESVEGTSGKSIFKTKNLTIECSTSALGTRYVFGIPVTSGLDTSGCSVAKPSGCKMPSTFEAKMKGTFIGAVPGGPPEEELAAEKGTTIMEVEITGCSLEAVYALTGTQTCKVDSTYETAKETHEFSCTPAGSKLKLGKEEATLERTVTDHLSKKGNWSIQLN